MTLKLITFDLDNTLWHTDPVIAKAEQVQWQSIISHYPKAETLFTPESYKQLKYTVVQKNPHLRHKLSFLRQEIHRQGLNCYRQHGAHALHVPYWWLRCLLWREGEKQPWVAAYHRLLVWDLMEQPALTRWIDKLCNPWMGKSVVMYFNKPRGVDQ